MQNSIQTNDLAVLSTEFRSPVALAGWRHLEPEGFAPKWQAPEVVDGRLRLRPLASGWFDDNQAGHLYREVTGDFIATARIEARGTQAALPQSEFSLAGLFVRAPRALSARTWTPGRENWLFFSTGTASPAGEPHYEIKSTTNSLSTIKVISARPGPVQLRIARLGELFTLLHKPEGAHNWSVVDQMIRPDLPQILNVGLTAYADWGSVAPTYPDYRAYNEHGVGKGRADLVADVDWIRFRRPAVGRFPIANLDAPATFGCGIIERRRRDLLAD
jgi:hypothetical protein